MVRFKKNVEAKEKVIICDAPLNIKKEENGNGIIVPVKVDDFSVFFDTKDKSFFAVIKIEGKKIILRKE